MFNPRAATHLRNSIVFALVGLLVGAVFYGFSAAAKARGRSTTAGSHAAAPDQNAPLLTNNYKQTNLVSDIPGAAKLIDSKLINPWGLAQSATSPFWVSNNGTSVATLYGGDVGGGPFSKNALTVSIPGNLPTGTVFNGSSDFVITAGGGTGPARFIFASITGNIAAWRAGTAAIIAASQAGHVYTGLAIGNNGTANFLYAADFKNKKIDVYDKNFASATLAGTFTDPTLPADFSPFNIQNLVGKLYVEYAKVDPATGRDLAGPGNGYVSVFDTNGVFQTRLVSNGPLNSPWGVTISPASFGVFGSALLVGNFGDGRINAFNPTTGAFLGTLNDEAGNPIEIDELWAITFGNGVGGGDTGSLYFNAGPGEEVHGIFGKLEPSVPATTLVQFSSANYSVAENTSQVAITVTRTGDLSQPSTVNYSTFTEAAVPGGDPPASQKSDFMLAAGTLNFAAGQASKAFGVLIIDDVFVENNEHIKLMLSNPTGAGLGSPSIADLVINENDVPGFTVPIPSIFVAIVNGAQEVPAKVTNGKGVAVVQLSADETKALVSLSFTGLGSNQTAAHIHGPAAPGVNAPVLFPLPNGSGTSFSFSNFQISPTPTQVQQFKNGLMYVNVHSTVNPGGEIRGQLLFNPIDEPGFFVRQNYFDFLNRDADSSGLIFWTLNLQGCNVDTDCISSRRIDVSAAFFFSTEFQQSGFFVYSVRKASFGLQPSYGQYVLDKTLLGTPSDANKTAFAEGFVQRTEFLAKYPATQNGSDFIDALIATIKNNSGVDLTPKRPELVNEYLLGATQAQSRARVIRKAISYTEFINAEFNSAFVLAQYFGYLRRNPDPAGYAFWLDRLNTNGGNFRSMVCSFITSSEYQLRFGPNVSRSNAECLP